MKHRWVVHVNGSASNEYEVSVVHTSFQHGIDSWGWAGEFKIIIDAGERVSKGYFKRMTERAEVVANALNLQDDTKHWQGVLGYYGASVTKRRRNK